MTRIDPASVGAEIEALIEKLSAASGSEAAAQAQELARHLMSLYGAGLARLLDIVRTEGGGPRAVLERFAGDPLLASLLALHGLHPHPIESRVERALSTLEPYLGPGVKLEVQALGEERARVRVHGIGPGGGTSPASMRAAVERAIREAAPEIETVDVEGLEEPLLQIIRPGRVASGGAA